MRIRQFVIILLTLCAVTPVQAQDKVEGSLQADFVSSYVWRGLRLGHVAVQPELSVGWKGLSLSAWGNVPLSKHEGDCHEIDLPLFAELHANPSSQSLYFGRTHAEGVLKFSFNRNFVILRR